MPDISMNTKDALVGGRRIIRIAGVKHKTGLSTSSVWRRTQDDPTFPRPRRLGPSAIGWFEDEVDAWLEARPVSRPWKVA